MDTLFVREIKIYAIWLVQGLFMKKSGNTITLLHERQQDGGESGFPFFNFLDFNWNVPQLSCSFQPHSSSCSNLSNM